MSAPGRKSRASGTGQNHLSLAGRERLLHLHGKGREIILANCRATCRGSQRSNTLIPRTSMSWSKKGMHLKPMCSLVLKMRKTMRERKSTHTRYPRMMSLLSTWIKTEEGGQVDERLCDRPHNK